MTAAVVTARAASLARSPLARSERPAPAPNATLVERIDVTPTIARFIVRPDAALAGFVAGQYVGMGLDVDGRLLVRPYSMASAPHDDHLEFLIRRVPCGALTSRLWAIASGSRLWLGRPKGLFTLAGEDARARLLVATGTGLAPFVSMLAARRSRRDREAVVLVHGVRTPDELAYRDRLAAAARDDDVAYVPVVSRPDEPASAGWGGETGRIDAVLPAICRRSRIDPAAAVAFLCGNPGMIEAVSAVLGHLGFAREAVVREQYWVESPVRG